MSRTHHCCVTSEIQLGCVLDELASNGSALERAGIGRIVRCERAEPNSRLDKKRIGFLVVVQTPEEKIVPIPLRLVRAGRRTRDFEEELNRRHVPHIRSLSLKRREDPVKLKEKVIQCLRAAVQLFQGGFRWLFRNYATVFAELDEMRAENNPGTPRHVSSKTMRQRRKAERNGFFRYSASWAC